MATETHFLDLERLEHKLRCNASCSSDNFDVVHWSSKGFVHNAVRMDLPRQHMTEGKGAILIRNREG